MLKEVLLFLNHVLLLLHLFLPDRLLLLQRLYLPFQAGLGLKQIGDALITLL